jgi:N-acylglucosamine 2-epimerase
MENVKEPFSSLPALREFLRQHLMESIVPFWLTHAVDSAGGLNTCIDDAGRVISRDKYLWSQLRAVYTFSALYRRIEPQQRFLDLATDIARFSLRHGRDERGHWVFCVDAQGKVLEGDKSIYADGFAIMGLVELFHATGDRAFLTPAIETFATVQRRLAQPGSYRTSPYDIPPGLKAHGVSMLFSLAYFELSLATGDPTIAAAALRLADEVMDYFRRPDRRALVEHVTLDGGFEDSPAGRAVVPGHAIESMWFQIHQYRALGKHQRVAQCIECMRWHIERGWDTEFGGLFLGLDLDGHEPPYWKFADTKLWWPQTEAMYATLLAHEICGESWCLEWYRKIHEAAFAHFPQHGHGEWTQRLDRHWRPLTQVVALPVKDPFHLPRALMLSIESLDRTIKLSR